MNLKTVVISSIELVRSAKFQNGSARFLVNAQSKNPIWLNTGFIKQVYTNIGLSTETPFQQLVGSTLTYYEFEITDAQLQAAGGKVTVTSPVQKREVEFTTAGKKSLDFSMSTMSQALQQNIFNVGVKIDSSWADTTVRTAPVQAPKVDMNNNEAPVVEEAEVIEDTLNDEAPGE